MQKINLNPYLRLYFLFILILIFLIYFPITKPYAMEKECYSMKLLFQELIFNVPQDRFFIISFNPQNAESSLLETIDYKTAIEKYGNKLNVDGEIDRVFSMASSRNNRYIVFYFKSKNGSYEYGFIDNQAHKLTIYNTYLLQANSEEINFLNNEKELVSQQYDNKPKMLSIKSDSFIKEPMNANIYYLFANCKLQKYLVSNNSNELIWKRASLITEAGLINGEWGWFCERINEKMAGNLFFINLRDFKPIRGPLNLQCKLIAIVK